MKTQLNRRRLLLGLAAASTAAAAVSVATPAAAAVAENPELVRLGDQLPVALAELEAAREAVEWIVAEWKHRWPLAPDEITLPRAARWEECAEKDIAYRPLVRPEATDPRAVRSVENAECGLRYVLERKLRPNATADRHARKEASIAARRREIEICKAYRSEVDAIRKASGIDEALARVDSAAIAVARLVVATLETPGRTMGGLLIQAQAIATADAAKINQFRYDLTSAGSKLAASIIRLAEGGAA